MSYLAGGFIRQISPMILLCLSAIGMSPFTSAAEPTLSDVLADVRSAAAGRDVSAAKAALRKADMLEADAKQQAERERLHELVDYLEQFWRAVEKGVSTLQATDEIEVGDTRVAVVEVLEEKVILRVAGQNRTYTPRSIPAKLAMVIAERAIKPTAAENKVIVGAFLALDAKGDAAKARQYWDEAQRGGIDVKRLLPELETPRPAPPVEIPTLTPQQKALLTPANWMLRTRDKKTWVKKPLESADNEEGRLTVKVPSDVEGQLVTKRAITGDFSCRLILQDVPEGQKLGFFAAENEDGFVVDLPKGTMEVALSRQGQTLKAKVGGRDVEVQTIGKPQPRIPGHLGITVPGGSQPTIAAVDFAAR